MDPCHEAAAACQAPSRVSLFSVLPTQGPSSSVSSPQRLLFYFICKAPLGAEV